jgi:glycine/D-amino acid oxidase-like deaminating enzyme
VVEAGGGAAHPYGRLSLWWSAVVPPVLPRAGLCGDLDVDVAIVGAGFTGLWTAHSLISAEPSLRVAVIEKEVAGFGASGRNGGWCSALFAVSDARLASTYGREAMTAMRRAMQHTVDEVGATAASEGIDCHFIKGGTIDMARNRTQVQRARAEVDEARELGWGEEDLAWLDGPAARERCNAEGVLGATYTPHCAAIQPALLVRGLADAVERRGVSLFEQTPALRITAGTAGRRPAVHTPAGTVRADVVVCALEAFGTTMPGERRRLVPVFSLMVATEPLPAAFFDEVGLARRETFADHRHTIIYGQRTKDDRLAFGGRGAPYHYGSAIDPTFDQDHRVHQGLVDTLHELFPALGPVVITHTWGGPVGIPRDWHSSVGLDRSRGLAWAGGYVGDGVSTTNLAGRTLADLIREQDSDLVHLPWVGHRSRPWEPEPLRWLGVNAGLWAARRGDRVEAQRGRSSRVATGVERILGV